MRKLLGFETTASLIVIMMTIFAQITANLLTYFPQSAFLWYADREIFGFIGVSEHSWMLEPSAIGFSVAIAALSFCAFCNRWFFVAGALSHACLFLAGKSIGMSIWAGRDYWGERLSWVSTFFRMPNASFLLLGLSSAILSAAACHFMYLSTIPPAPPGAARPLRA
ncbi:hypothetical protein [Rhodoblastus sp.]|uniref:hypothetical protein n=1 Tax=Rhodoblastus sp. TaxID=1962975 RepID=UPI003F9AB1C0